MSKTNFVELAEEIRLHNNRAKLGTGTAYTPDQIESLASFCKSQNPRFMRERWLGYIAGTNGKNGGAVKGA